MSPRQHHYYNESYGNHSDISITNCCARWFCFLSLNVRGETQKDTLQDMIAWLLIIKMIRCSLKMCTLSRVNGDRCRIGWSYGLHKQNKRSCFDAHRKPKCGWGWWLVPIMASNRGQCTMFTFWLAYQSYAKWVRTTWPISFTCLTSPHCCGTLVSRAPVAVDHVFVGMIFHPHHYYHCTAHIQAL